jgi:type I restriction-modification system DNA methylase subunit
MDAAEGKKGGQFYTPSSVVRLLVEMLAPYNGRVYDPCCGSGGMFVQSEKFVEAHGGRVRQISVYGQESNYTTWRLCKMNLAIRGINGQIGHGDTFHADAYPDVPGFCKAAGLEEMRKHGHVFTPGCYVGAAEVEEEGEPFAEKRARLTGELNAQWAQAAALDAAIRANLRRLGFGG